MTNQTKFIIVLLFIIGIFTGAAIFYFFLNPSVKPINTSLFPTTTQSLENPQPTSPISTSKSLSTLPIGVSVGMSNQWFESWATSNDILIAFSNNLPTTTKPSKGKLGWNNPSFANIKQTESQWLNKVNVILYDYETWTKTPQDEQANPEQTAKDIQQYADQKGVELVFGTSWKMITVKGASQQARNNLSSLNFSELIDIAKVQAIARNVKNFGVNASGLRQASVDAYIAFFNTAATYAKEVNPTIKLVPVLDARSESAEQLVDMIKKLGNNIDSVMIMGTAKEQSVIDQLITLLRK